jgi:putative ABC transport system permease protein
MHDLRFALRQLIKSRGFTAAAVFTMALGIGANAAVFSVVNSVLLRPLPYKDPNALWMVLEKHQTRELEAGLVSMEDYLDFKAQATSFEELAAFTSIRRDLTGNSEPERIQMGVVSQNLFPALGVAPTAGRNFSREEDNPGGERVVLLSYELWQRRFDRDPGIIGKSVSISDVSYIVIGAMPKGFGVGRLFADAWTPARGAPGTTARDFRIFNLIGRQKAGVSMSRAQTEMNALAARLAQQYPKTNAGFGVQIVPLRLYLTNQVRTGLLVLFGAVALVLLIACSNVANLVLVRAISREKEMAIRSALGASRARLLRQLATEGLVLTTIGGALGFLISLWARSAMTNLLPIEVPRLAESHVDGRVLIFFAAMAILAGIIFGLVPGLRFTGGNLIDSLKDRGISAGKNMRHLRTALVVAELSLAVMLLIAAGLLIQSFARLQRVDPGFAPKNLLTMEVVLPRSRYAENNQRMRFFAELVSRIEKLPGVRAAAATLQAPLVGLDVDKSTFVVRGAGSPLSGQEPDARLHVVTPEYFDTLNVALHKGRMFTERDDSDAPGVLIINEAMARRYWPNESPLGQQLTLGLRLLPNEPATRTIVGVVGNVRHFGLAAADEPQMYIPHRQTPWPEMTLVVRGMSDASALASAVRAQVTAMDKELPVAKVKTIEQGLSESVAQPRFFSWLLGCFASLAIALAAVGFYSVMAYSVAQRTNEIGVRMALGARETDILTMILREGSLLVVLGLTLGLAAAFALTRLLASLLFGVGVNDPVTFIAVPLLLGVIGLLACFLPARRATKVDPVIALRHS